MTTSLSQARRTRLVVSCLAMLGCAALAPACSPGGFVAQLTGQGPSGTGSGALESPDTVGDSNQKSAAASYGDGARTTVVLSAHLPDGQTLRSDEINCLIDLLRQRAERAGWDGATVTARGANEIEVDLPGHVSDSATSVLAATVRMQLRPVLRAGFGFAGTSATNSSWLDYDGAVALPAVRPLPTPAPSRVTMGVDPSSDIASWVGAALSFGQITPEIEATFVSLRCAQAGPPISTGAVPADGPLVTCSKDGETKYILGPVLIDGSQVTSVVSRAETSQGGSAMGRHEVEVQFDSAGSQVFSEASDQMMGFLFDDAEAVTYWASQGADGVVRPGSVSDVFTQSDGTAIPDRNHFALVLDGVVLSSPAVNSQITDGSAQITGAFTQEDASALASQLALGAAPVSLQIESVTTR